MSWNTNRDARTTTNSFFSFLFSRRKAGSFFFLSLCAQHHTTTVKYNEKAVFLSRFLLLPSLTFVRQILSRSLHYFTQEFLFYNNNNKNKITAPFSFPMKISSRWI